MATKRKVPEAKAASIDFVMAAVEALTEKDIYRLERFARGRIWIIKGAADGRDALDLLGQAYQQTLEGQRTWNTDETFVQYLENTMQSISGNWAGVYKTQMKNGRDRIVSDKDSRTDLIETIASVDPVAVAEEEARYEERLQAIRTLFDDDAVASVIVAGWEDGLEGGEIRAILDNMEETPYRSKVRWMQRKLTAAGYRQPTATQKGPRP